MATLLNKASFHARSISLPKPEHPLTTSVEDQLCKLRASSEVTTSSINHRLRDLKELYARVDDVLQMPLTQQALFNEKDNIFMENALDGSLGLLDICGTTRDIFSQMKECLQEFESSLRRRRGGESSFVAEVGAYIICRKKLNKMVVKCFDNLKKMQKNCTSTPVLNDSMINMLKEVELHSLHMFESLLDVISQQKGRLTPKALVTRLLQFKSAYRKACDGNEVQRLDYELLYLCKSGKAVNVTQTQYLLKEVKMIELSIQELEEELEYFFRLLMKTRVSLLNILNH